MPGDRRRHRNRNRNNNNDAPNHGRQGGNNKRHGGGHGRHGGNHGRPEGNNARHGGRNDRQVVHNGQRRVNTASNVETRPGYQGGPRYHYAMNPATNTLRSVPYYEHMGYDNYSVRTGLPLNGRGSQNSGNFQLTWGKFMEEVRRGNGLHNNEGNYEIKEKKPKKNPYGNFIYHLNTEGNYCSIGGDFDYDKVSSDEDWDEKPSSDHNAPETNAKEQGRKTPPPQNYDQALNRYYEAVGITGNRDGREPQAQYEAPHWQDESRNQQGRPNNRPNKKQRNRNRRRAQEQETVPNWNYLPVDGSGTNQEYISETSQPDEELNRASPVQPMYSFPWAKGLVPFPYWSCGIPDCEDDEVHSNYYDVYSEEESPETEEQQESEESSSESGDTTNTDTENELAELKLLIKEFMDIGFVRKIMKLHSEEKFEALHAMIQD
ncbi:unnamed protein product [Caenorhabditis brenneri]